MSRSLSKTIITVVLCAIVVGIGVGLSNLAVLRAAPEPAVVGKIDGNKLGSEFPAMKKAWDNIAKQKAALEKELNSKAEGQDQDTQKHLLDQYNEKYNDFARKELDPATKALEAAIAAVAKEKGVTVIVDSSVVHFGAVDLTDAVLKKGGAK